MDGKRKIASWAGLYAGVFLQSTYPRPPRRSEPWSVTPGEAMMREHAVSERVLLVYERLLKDERVGEKPDLTIFHQAAGIAKALLHDRHEKMEEQHVFPLFRRDGYLTDLLDVLAEQHRAGAGLTDKILDLASPGSIRDQAHRTMLMTLCRSFIFMYRPHMARESTELYPRMAGLAGLAGPGAARTGVPVGDGAELAERQKEVAALEQALDIADLKQYTIG